MADKIYLDYAATTPVDPEVFEAMKPYFVDDFGNASSAHQFGQKAREALDRARDQVAGFLGSRPEEVIFNSGATESTNLSIKGVIKKISVQNKDRKLHVITSNIEHHCVLDTCKTLEEEGQAEVTYLPVNKEGLVDAFQVEEAIKNNTVLISIMYANNEIGSVQPIEEIGRLVKKVNAQRPQNGRIYFHTDAVQAINYLNCHVDDLGADLLSLSAHKFYGPKGVGVLYVRKGTPIKRIQDGGAHEYNVRAGTYNIPGIVGLGKAISMMNEQAAQRIRKLRDKMIEGTLKKIPGSRLNGSPNLRLQNNAHFSFRGAEGESIVMALDSEGIAVSTGSACASEDLQPSHVLMALGLAPEDSHTSIRVTLGKYTTEEQVNRFLEILPKVIDRIRKISGSGGQSE